MAPRVSIQIAVFFYADKFDVVFVEEKVSSDAVKNAAIAVGSLSETGRILLWHYGPFQKLLRNQVCDVVCG
jgi:hypothetical protein